MPQASQNREKRQKTGTVTSLMKCVWIYGHESSTWLVIHRCVAFVTMAQAAELEGCQPTHIVCLPAYIVQIRRVHIGEKKAKTLTKSLETHEARNSTWGCMPG